MPGAEDPDYNLRVHAENAATRYRLTFGSLIRGGNVYQHPELDRPIDGRTIGGVATAAPGETHRWRADGPITLFNNGRGTLVVTFDGGDGQSFAVPPQGSINTNCPTEKKRLVGLAMVGGGTLTLLGGWLLDRGGMEP